MASSSKLKPSTGDEDQEEELERFDDFTLASSWERFISEIEAICRQWLTIGPKILLEKGAEVVGLSQNLYRVKSELKYITKSYSMEYYFEINSGGKTAVWDLKMHDLQLCFGVKEFLVIAPLSASGVILDAPEASKLLSAVAIALSNCCSLWPAFVPVHDPSRKSYIGIQNMGTVFTRRFEADRLSSQVPVKLMHLEGLYELFVSKFAFSTLDLAIHSLKVHFTMRSTYKTISDDDDDNLGIRITESTEHEADPSGESNNKSQWDDDCPWSEWYTSEDPVKGAELIAVWPEKVVESSLEMAELENTSPHDAETWMILPIFSQNLDSSGGNRVGFASQLRLLVDALDLSFSVQFMEDFVSAENPGSDNLKSSMVVPPPSVLDRVFKDLFHEAGIPNFAEGEHKKSRFIKGAPLGSLFAQFCLHSLWVGNCNIRAIAVLWIEFVREVRWCWEESQPLPKMPCDGSIDLSTCLINQKLQMLAICIEKKSELNEEFEDCIGSNEHNNNRREEDGAVTGNRNATQMSRGNFNRTRDSTANHDNVNVSVATSSSSSMRRGVVSSAKDSSDYSRRGSAGAVNSMMLLKSYKSLHTPFTQAAPPMTEDMHEERLHAVEAFENSFDFSAQLEKDILTSDMSAFKAANPDAVFEDFIRWHSPGDWVSEETKEKPTRSSSTGDLKDDWPPRGCLSKRMSDHGNLWRKLWDNAPALPALEQKPLLDPSREGEKILHYLETLQPHQLLEQMVCTAFRASADTLNQTNFGDLKQMVTKIEQLYSTISSTLRPLQKNRLCPKSETIEDLRQLCTVFEHVEKLLAVAASLHRKFLQAPRLSSKIFSDYYNFYLPSMGTGSRDADQKEFDMRQRVSNHERQVVSNLFVPPSASQSWRKVLSMGNLLNGHEPIIREIIFYVQESLSDHYAARNPRSFQQDIETYRMYISGTSNDLRVALSVTSCD